MSWSASGVGSAAGVERSELTFSPEFDTLSEVEQAQIAEAVSCAHHLAVTGTVGDSVSVELSGHAGDGTSSVSVTVRDNSGAEVEQPKTEKVGAATGS